VDLVIPLHDRLHDTVAQREIFGRDVALFRAGQERDVGERAAFAGDDERRMQVPETDLHIAQARLFLVQHVRRLQRAELAVRWARRHPHRIVGPVANRRATRRTLCCDERHHPLAELGLGLVMHGRAELHPAIGRREVVGAQLATEADRHDHLREWRFVERR
jgi:hypothetical protein